MEELELNQELFYNLFEINNELEFINEKYKIQNSLKTKEKLKEFDDKFKVYSKLFKNKMRVENAMKLPPNNYNISNLDAGNYECTEDLIKDKNGNIICYHPLVPVEKYKNNITGIEKIKVAFYKEEKWNEIIVNKSDISVSNKIINLSDIGIEVTSENSKDLVKYLNEILNINIDKIKTNHSISHIGWVEEENGEYKFLPYDDRGLFDGAEEFKNIYDSIKPKGNYDKWYKTAKELRKNKTIKLLMATVFASPLIERLDIQSYIVNVWSGESGNGKTLSCMVAMSVWGNPDIGKLRFSSNNTQIFFTLVASFMNNITCYFDEFQIVEENRNMNIKNLIMDLCNQTERGKATKESKLKQIRTWNCNFLFTNNNRLAKDTYGEQYYNRILDLEIKGKVMENGNEVAGIIKNNYGHAGEKYISCIKKIGIDKIKARFKEIYDEIIQNTVSTDKQASSVASLILADEIVCKYMFDEETPLKIDDMLEFINDKEDVRTSIKAYEYIIDIINANSKRFDPQNYSETWGKKDEYYCTINKTILCRELKKGGFEFDSIKKEWSNEKKIEANSQGRYCTQTTVNGQNGTFVKLKMMNIE